MDITFSAKPRLPTLLSQDTANSAAIRVTEDLFETDLSLLKALLANGSPGDVRLCGIVENYLTDIKLGARVQPDLFRAMSPYIWSAWQESLLSNTCIDASSEVASTFFQKPTLIHDLLGVAFQRNVEEFIRDSILHATNVDSNAAASMRWVPFWVSQCACWPTLVATVWDGMARLMVPNHVRSVMT